MIKIDKLSKKLGGYQVLKDVASEIPTGSIYGLIGSNGAGKSTLLNLIDGIYRSDTGSITIDGKSVYEDTELKNKIAYIPDDPYYFNSYSMLEMADYLNTAYPSFSKEKFKTVAENFPLDIKARISTFSKGMKRQAAIVFALSQNPDILLCDECFDGLDPVVKQLVKKLIINEVTERNMTVIISSHNLREMESLCDIIGILHNNTIIVEKRMEDIKERLHKFQLAFKPMIDTRELSGLDLLNVEIRGSILELVARGKREEIISELSKLNPILTDEIELSLEDIFIYEMEATGYDFSKILM